MSTHFELPSPEATASLLGIMFGDDIDVKQDAEGDVANHYIATFLDDEDKLVAACACDIAFVVNTGAALSMIPKNAASDMIKDGQPTDMVLSNFHEVMNICSKLMMSDDSAHLRLEKVMKPGEAAEALGALESGGTRLHFDVGTPGYGPGKLAVLIAQD